MRKVVIVTVYNSLNAGSFFQATFLYKTLEKLGYDAAFLNTGARNLGKQAFIEMLSLCKHGDFRGAIEKVKTAKLFEEKLKEYQIIKETDVEKDIFVLGSDEIWNVNRECMSKYPVFWGKGLNYKRSISYAPSINKATTKELQSYPFVSESLENLHAISVRDTYSKDELSQITNREIVEVCDPTVLVYPEAYNAIENNCKYSNYVLIYAYYNAFTNEEIEAIKAFATKYNKKIIAFGMTQRWCDYNVYGSPDDFLMYIKYADYVCTCTFHGTMLSLIFQKQFAVIGKKKPRKVQELMNRMELNRFANANTLEAKLLEKYDYEQCDKCLVEWKESSLNYLVHNIEEII